MYMSCTTTQPDHVQVSLKKEVGGMGKDLFSFNVLPFLFNVFSCFRSVIHRVSCTQTNILQNDKTYFSFIVKFSFISYSSVLIIPPYHPHRWRHKQTLFILFHQLTYIFMNERMQDYFNQSKIPTLLNRKSHFKIFVNFIGIQIR